MKNHTENCGFPCIVEAENEDPSFFVTNQRREQSSEHYPHFSSASGFSEFRSDLYQNLHTLYCKTQTLSVTLIQHRKREREDDYYGTYICTYIWERSVSIDLRLESPN